MTQEAIQISETPPLPGLKLVQDTNKAFQTIATDFAGPTDPAGLDGCVPYCKWADTANGLIKRRNAANTDWVVIGSLFLNAGTDHAGSEPANPVPFMTWADTANGLVKRRSADNAAWAVEGELFTYKANRNGDATQNFKAAPAADTGDVVTFEQAFGVGQLRQNVIASRAWNTNYTNTFGKPIYVAVTFELASGARAQLSVSNDGSYRSISRVQGVSGTQTVHGVIFPDEIYRLDLADGGNTTLTYWLEAN